MAVVNLKSNLFPTGGGADSAAVDPQVSDGYLKFAAFSVANAASDNNLSDYLLCEIPADALLDKASEIRTDLWGFATVNLGIRGAVTSLATAARGTGATFLNPVSSTVDSNQQPAWQALGYAARPASGVVQIYASATADATGAGTLKGKIAYRDAA